MVGLIKKEFHVLSASGQLFLILWVLPILASLGGLPREFGRVFSLIWVTCAPLVMVSISQAEEAWRWSDFILCAPVKRSQVVLAKYLLNFLVAVGSVFLAALCDLLPGGGGLLPLLPVALGAAFLLSAVALPILFRFHSVAARTVASILGGLAGSVGGAVGAMSEDLEVGLTISKTVSWSVLGIGFLLMVLSCPLSVRLYEKNR